MGSSKKTLWLAVAAAMLVPSKARSRGRDVSSFEGDVASQRRSRRFVARHPQTLPGVTSPCGRHVVGVVDGVMFLDGRRVHPASGSVFLIAQPTWRRDGLAVAWLERHEGQTQLVVVPTVDEGTDPLPWTLPAVSDDDQIFWAGPRRVVVGPALLVPRAVATWTE
jgi:hypothetical protein